MNRNCFWFFFTSFASQRSFSTQRNRECDRLGENENDNTSETSPTDDEEEVVALKLNLLEVARLWIVGRSHACNGEGNVKFDESAHRTWQVPDFQMGKIGMLVRRWLVGRFDETNSGRTLIVCGQTAKTIDKG